MNLCCEHQVLQGHHWLVHHHTFAETSQDAAPVFGPPPDSCCSYSAHEVHVLHGELSPVFFVLGFDESLVLISHSRVCQPAEMVLCLLNTVHSACHFCTWNACAYLHQVTCDSETTDFQHCCRSLFCCVLKARNVISEPGVAVLNYVSSDFLVHHCVSKPLLFALSGEA